MRSKALTRTAIALMSAAAFSASLGNQPPTVDAGEYDTVPTGKGVYLNPQVEDDSTDFSSLTILWTQISGPAQSTIFDSSAAFTSVRFSVAGSYVFVLSATDAQRLTASDAATILVREPIPFEVLAPKNNQPVTRGQPFMIRWRNEGSAACRVYITLDEGLTETMISTEATYDSLLYSFDSDLPAGTPGRILLRYYPGAGPQDVVVSGSFVLVDTVVQAVSPMRGGSRRSGLRPVGGERVLVNSAWSPTNRCLFDVKGRSLTAASQSIGAGLARRAGVVFVRRHADGVLDAGAVNGAE